MGDRGIAGSKAQSSHRLHGPKGGMGTARLFYQINCQSARQFRRGSAFPPWRAQSQGFAEGVVPAYEPGTALKRQTRQKNARGAQASPGVDVVWNRLWAGWNSGCRVLTYSQRSIRYPIPIWVWMKCTEGAAFSSFLRRVAMQTRRAATSFSQLLPQTR